MLHNKLGLDDEAIADHLSILQETDFIKIEIRYICINDWWYFLGVEENDKLRREVYERDGYACVYCGGSPEHLDHIWPKSRGGKDTITNLVTSCQICNMSKKDHPWLEWYKSQPYYSPLSEEYISRIWDHIISEIPF